MARRMRWKPLVRCRLTISLSICWRGESENSGENNNSALQAIKPTIGSVTDVTGDGNDGKVTLGWTPLTSDQIASTGATGYEIYYIDNSAQGAATLSKDTVGATKVAVAGATTNSKEIAELDPTKTYKFVIYAVNGSTYSTVSSVATGTAVDYVAAKPAEVSEVTHSNDTGPKMKLSGTYIGETNQTIKVKVATVDSASGIPLTWSFSYNDGAFGKPGTATFFPNTGLTFDFVQSGVPSVEGDTFTFTATAAIAESN